MEIFDTSSVKVEFVKIRRMTVYVKAENYINTMTLASED